MHRSGADKAFSVKGQIKNISGIGDHIMDLNKCKNTSKPYANK